MGVGAGLYMYVVVVQKFTFAISSPDEFLYITSIHSASLIPVFRLLTHFVLHTSGSSFSVHSLRLQSCVQNFCLVGEWVSVREPQKLKKWDVCLSRPVMQRLGVAHDFYYSSEFVVPCHVILRVKVSLVTCKGR